jgi:hypothetical protein
MPRNNLRDFGEQDSDNADASSPSDAGVRGERSPGRENGPRVDERLLLALARRELSDDEARRACEMVALHRTWRKALANILLHDFLESEKSTTDETE